MPEHTKQEIEDAAARFRTAAERLADTVEDYLHAEGVTIEDLSAAWQAYVDAVDED